MEIEYFNNQVVNIRINDKYYIVNDEVVSVIKQLQQENQELEEDLKTLWIALWNNDTEMTSYQSEIFDKYYDEFHKKEVEK